VSSESEVSPIDHPDLEDTCCETPMWSIIILLIAATALVLGSRLRVPGGVNAEHLGWMSAQWLAEYRASQRTL
jgi:hypothetical protein